MAVVLLFILVIAVSSRGGSALVRGCLGLVFGGLLILVGGALL